MRKRPHRNRPQWNDRGGSQQPPAGSRYDLRLVEIERYVFLPRAIQRHDADTLAGGRLPLRGRQFLRVYRSSRLIAHIAASGEARRGDAGFLGVQPATARNSQKTSDTRVD